MKSARYSILAAGLFLTTAALIADNTPYSDTREYVPLELAWNTNTGISQVRNVFPHPVLVQTAVLATDSGLLLSEDVGKSWKALPEAAVAKIGPVCDVAFDPLAPDAFYVASATKGVWITKDKGATFHQIGTKARGMASDSVANLIVYAGDPGRQTLLAVHGSSAPGMSRSRNGGQTWEVLNANYNFSRVLGGSEHSPQIFLFGSTVKDPEVQNCYTCNTAGEFPIETLRDVVPTDMASAPVRERGGDVVYVATSDSGLYRISNDDIVSVSHTIKQLPVKDVNGWASVAVVWGPNADAMRLFVYDPAGLGLAVSTDDLATIQTSGKELLVSPLIKEGSVIRPNANGTVFYAAVNGSLSIGRSAKDVPVVDLSPAVFKLEGNENAMLDNLRDEFQKFYRATEFSRTPGSTAVVAKDLCQRFGDLKAPYEHCRLTVTARLPLQPAPPVSVTADLSRFGGSPETPLYDDGQHDDGAAGDGVYGLTFALQPLNHQPVDSDWRCSWPGRVALGITATFADGRRQGAVGVLGIYTLLKDFDVWSQNGGNIAADCSGEVKVRPVLNPPDVHKGSGALRLDAAKGAWSVIVNVPSNMRDITSYGSLSFYIRANNGEPPKELYAQLGDEPEFSDPTTTERVPLFQFIREGGIAGDYRRVVVPISRMLGNNSQFQTGRLKSIILSGTTDGPVTLYVDGPRINASSEPPVPQEKTSRK